MTRAPVRLMAGIAGMLMLATALPALAQRNPAAKTPVTAEDTEAPVDRRALIDGGETPGLFLLYTGDVIGYLDPCG